MSQVPDPSQVPPPSNVPPASVPYSGTPAKEEMTMAMLCYILGIFGWLGWVGPLIVWMVKKDTSPFVNDQGKEVLNWELTILPIYLSAFLFCIPILGWLLFLLAIITFFVSLVFCIIGAIKSSKGVAYRMPFSIKYIK